MKRLHHLYYQLFPTLTYRVCFWAISLVSLVVSVIPLFNVVGYESAAFFGVVCGAMALGLTLHAYRHQSFVCPLQSARESSPAHDFSILLARHLLLGTVPLLILTINALRVQNCDYMTGLAFWGAITWLSILMGQSSAWLGVMVFPARRVLRTVIAWSLPVASAVMLGWHLYSQPPIVGHDLLLGYLSGSIYDEALTIPRSLLWYRAVNLCAVIGLIAGVEAWWRHDRGRSKWSLIIVGFACVMAMGAIVANSHKFGIYIDREFIEEELGGRVESEHFVIYYPETQWFEQRIDLLIEDHEFRYAQLKAYLGEDPVASSGKKVRSFVYSDRETKGQLMGARNTLVAKLWLHEMHILWRHYGDNMLTHELAHIFSEPFGTGPLRLSTQRGIGVNMGLVEGLATAADWPISEFDPHEASAAMRQLGIAPDIRGLLGATGFWTQASGRAYTLMGSFIRYLVDEFGIETFKKAYARGDFVTHYGMSSDALVALWEEFLVEIELSSAQLELAGFLFDRPSIFGKTCARAIAEWHRSAAVARSQGKLRQAQRLYERILAFDSDNPRYVMQYLTILDRLRDFERLDAALRDSEQVPWTPVQRAQVLALQGDLWWHRGDAERALSAYDSCLNAPLPQELERPLHVKRQLVREDGPVRELGYEFFLGPQSRELHHYFLMQLHAQSPENPNTNYLLGRALWHVHRCADALPYLEAAIDKMHVAALDAELNRMIGQCYYFQGRFDAAEAVFSRLEKKQQSRYSRDALQWKQRVNWKRHWNRSGQ